MGFNVKLCFLDEYDDDEEDEDEQFEDAES